MNFHGCGHVLTNDAVNACCCLDNVEPDLFTDIVADRLARPLGINLDLASQSAVGVEIPKHNCRVRHSCILAATAVTGRPRISACAGRANLHETCLVNARDAAATCSYFNKVDNRQPDWQAAAALEPVHARCLELRREFRLSR
jgi:hypothetical protein